MLAIIYVLTAGGRGYFSCAVLTRIPGNLRSALLDASLLGSLFSDSWTHPSYQGWDRLEYIYHAWPCTSRRLLAR